MSTGGHLTPLAFHRIAAETDIVLTRQRAREIARALGFQGQALTRISTAVSEIARNAFQYAGGGTADFSVLTEPHPADARRLRQTFLINVRDKGPGIARLDEILSGNFRSETGLGLGINGSRRLMDRADVTTGPGGTHVALAKVVPPVASTRTPAQLEELAAQLAAVPAPRPLEELRIQNQELVAAMEEARKRQEEVVRVNRELAETNTGVLALYDELETLNRISVMLASKLELKPLIQSIVDVTTGLTDADLGAFFFWDGDDAWNLYATSGTCAGALSGLRSEATREMFHPNFATAGMSHIDDLEVDDIDDGAARIVDTLSARMSVRSCLAVPVLESRQALMGAFVFASARPGAFSERSKRILNSVSTQAAVGIEKARLFQTVAAASEAKDQFFATLSHELRTPLNPALAIISSLQDDPRLSAEVREDIAIVARNIRLEARLIDDLLEFNRLIKGKVDLTAEAVDLHALIRNVVQICSEDIEQKGHRLSVDLASPRSVIIGDSARLQQVLWNVLKNAIKFTPAGGSIAIRTREAGSMLEISVADSGCGIEPGELNRIFNAFDQGQRSSGFGGLGLGLSIARGFVHLHHGEIKAGSAGAGQGATVTISLPLSDASPAASLVPRAAETPPAGHGHILLVDDHHDTLRSLARLFTRRGFQVTPIASGAEAIAAVEKESFDLLISDLGLPDCSGIDLVAKIAAIQPLPAIALSGYGMESDLAESTRAGFRVHLTKPVDFEQLMVAVEKLLDGG
ncbi:MAG TPA: ATP-binding protein [Chthoniobacteraceae bacterium]|jgi:signal transduction histidine kinase|nr:ATP-binding protein [Chthoniobacteraceae bacterium]